MAVGLANQGETVLAWDRVTGEPLSPLVVWQDRRSADLCAGLSDHGDRLAAVTGLSLDPYFAAPEDGLAARAGPPRRASSRRATRGSSTSSPVPSSPTPRPPRARCCSTSTPSAGRPRPSRCSASAARRCPRWSAAPARSATPTAFGGAVPLTGLVVDQQAALLAEGCLEPGSAKCTYGTGAFVLAHVGSAPVRSTAGLPTSVAWQVAGATDYCLDGQVYTVASAVALAHRPRASSPAPTTSTGSARRWTAPGGVVLVPSLAGLGAPWWEPEAKGSMTGLGLETTAAHLVRALCEGIAAQVAALAGAMAGDLGRPLTALRVDGGLTRSTILMQTQADLLQLPVEVYASPDATALGAAAFARLGLEPGLALADALEPWRPAATYEPRIGPDEAAERLAVQARCRRGRCCGPVSDGHPVTGSLDYDVVVVGAGVVGCAIARELALRPWRVALVEASDDVGDGTSKANTAILHTGFDAAPGTLESRLVARGYALLSAYAAAAGIPVERVGALLVAWDEDQLAALPGLADKAARNGYTATRSVLGRGALRPRAAPRPWGAGRARGARRVDHLPVDDDPRLRDRGGGARRRAAARAPGSTAVSPRAGGGHVLTTSAGEIAHDVRRQRGRAAQRRGRPVASGTRGSRSRRGVVSSSSSTSSRGRWCPTSCCRCPRRAARACSSRRRSTATCCSARPPTTSTTRRRPVRLRPGWKRCGVKVFVSCRRCSTRRSRRPTPVCAQRPSMATTRSSCTRAGVRLRRRHPLHRSHRVSRPRRARGRADGGGRVDDGSGSGVDATDACRTSARRSRGRMRSRTSSATDPDYGRIVCHCERVTAGELRDALEGPVPAVTTEGLRRRTRAGMGRCQGFFCGAAVEARLQGARERQVSS